MCIRCGKAFRLRFLSRRAGAAARDGARAAVLVRDRADGDLSCPAGYRLGRGRQLPRETITTCAQCLAWDGLGTLVCGFAGSIVSPVIYAMLPPYKAMGARIGLRVVDADRFLLPP